MEVALTNPSGRLTLGSSVVRIGSAQDNHVVINDPSVAPYHAEIRPEGHGEPTHTIIDLGSTTGTFVNERQLDYNVPSLLRPNDTIRIGEAVFNYEVTGAPQMRPPTRGPTPHDPTPAPSGTETPQMGTTVDGDPGLVPHQQADTTPPTPDVYPQGGYPSSAYSPASAFAPPPTGGMAPVSPLASISPAYTVASLLEKENRVKLWLAGGLTVLVILIVAFLFGSFHAPGRTLDTFCSALHSRDYQTAYNQLSPGLQGIVTESRFAEFINSSGRVTSCIHSSPNVSGNSAVAKISTNSGPVSTVWLIQDSSFNWRIDGLAGL